MAVVIPALPTSLSGASATAARCALCGMIRAYCQCGGAGDGVVGGVAASRTTWDYDDDDYEEDDVDGDGNEVLAARRAVLAAAGEAGDEEAEGVLVAPAMLPRLLAPAPPQRAPLPTTPTAYTGTSAWRPRATAAAVPPPGGGSGDGDSGSEDGPGTESHPTPRRRRKTAWWQGVAANVEQEVLRPALGYARRGASVAASALPPRAAAALHRVPPPLAAVGMIALLAVLVASATVGSRTLRRMGQPGQVVAGWGAAGGLTAGLSYVGVPRSSKSHLRLIVHGGGAAGSATGVASGGGTYDEFEGGEWEDGGTDAADGAAAETAAGTKEEARDYATPLTDHDEAQAIWESMRKGPDAAQPLRPPPDGVNRPYRAPAQPRRVSLSWLSAGAAAWARVTRGALPYLPPEAPERDQSGKPPPPLESGVPVPVSPLVALVEHRDVLTAEYAAITTAITAAPRLTPTTTRHLSTPGALFASRPLTDSSSLWSTSRVVFLFHACGAAADAWVLGAQERAVVGELLQAEPKTLLIAVTASAAGGGATASGGMLRGHASEGCWSTAAPAVNPDIANIATLLKDLTAVQPSLSTAPYSALGVASGGTFASLLATAMQLDTLVAYGGAAVDRFMDALPPIGTAQSQPARGGVAVAAEVAVRWAAEATGIPPTLRPTALPDMVWVVAAQNTVGAAAVAVQQRAALHAGLGATVYNAPPLALYPYYFSDALPSRLSRRASAGLVAYLRSHLYLRPMQYEESSLDLAAAASAAGVSGMVVLGRSAGDQELRSLVTAYIATHTELPLAFHAITSLVACGDATVAGSAAGIRRAALCSPEDMLLDVGTEISFVERMNLDLAPVPVTSIGSAGAYLTTTDALLSLLAEAEGIAGGLTTARLTDVVTLALRSRTRAPGAT